MSFKKSLLTFLCAIILATMLPAPVLADDAGAQPPVQVEESTEKPTEESTEQPAEEPENPVEAPSEAPSAEPSPAPEQQPSETPSEESAPSPSPVAIDLSVRVEDEAALDGVAVFKAEVEPDGTNGLEFQWQRLNTEAWETAPEDAEQEDYWRDISGEDGRELKLEGLDQDSFTRYRYRCRVSAGDLDYTSEAARVTALEYTPEESPEVSPEVTPEASPEVTPEASLEVTPEASPEVTPEASPEVTPEASPEVTPEPSPEVTPEASVEPSPEPSPAALVAKGVAVASGTCGDNVTWYYIDDGTLKITGTGAMYDFTQYTQIAYNYRGSIKRVVIESGVTSVGAYAFYSDYNLTSVSLPAGLTSIGSYAFGQCGALAGLTLPAGLTLIGSYAFTKCNALASLTLPSGLTSIGTYAFAQCNQLTGVTLPGSLTSISAHAFRECPKLSSVSLAEGLTSIGAYAFYSCTALTGAQLPGGLTSIGEYAFYGCAKLTGLSLPASLQSIGDRAYYNCAALSGISLPSGSLMSIGASSFCNCTGLISVTLPTGLASIGSNAFNGCTNLASIALPNSVTAVGNYALAHCDRLANVTLSSSMQSLNEGLLRDCPALRSIALPADLTSIGKLAFEKCTALEAVQIPSRVTSIGDNAFDGCAALQSLSVPSSVTSIGGSTFVNCTGLKSFVLQGSVTSLPPYTLSGCAGLTSVQLPSGLAAIGDYALSGCSGLTSIQLPSGLAAIGNYALSGCSGLLSISIPDGVGTIGGDAFSGCAALQSVALPSGLTSLGGSAFNGCTSLTSVQLPDGLSSVPAYAFYNCSSLASAKLPTGATAIYDNAFSYCAKLLSISIPTTVTEIGVGAFYGCKSLTAVDLPNAVYWVYDGAFEACSKLARVTLPRDAVLKDYAFNGCQNLKTVYYRGNADDWKYFVMDLGQGNGVLKSAKLYYAIDAAKITAPGQIYTGGTLTPKPTVTFYGIALKEGADYKVTGYAGNTNAGEATITIQGIGKHAGTASGAFTIAPKDIALCLANATGSKYGDAMPQCQVWVADGDRELQQGVDYLYDFTEGLMSVALSGIGNYQGTLTLKVDFRTLEDSGDCGGSLQWKLYASGRLEITGSGEMTGYPAGGAPWYPHRAAITQVFLGAEVQSVSKRAFDGCDNLKGFLVESGNPVYRAAGGALVSLDGVLIRYPAGSARGGYSVPAGIKRIAQDAFQSCGNLTSITLPASLVFIEGDALGDCGNLFTVSMAPGSTSYRARGGALYDASGTALLRCPKKAPPAFTVPTGTQAISAGAFAGCQDLNTLALPASVQSIGNDAFEGCSGLTEVRFIGSKAEWSGLIASAGSGNGALTSATVRCDLAAFAASTDATHYPFTGSEITPIITVSRGGEVLAEGTDYSLSYASNVEVGQAIAVVTGTGGYTGSLQVPFEITSLRVFSVSFPLAAITIGVGQAADAKALAVVLPATAENKALSWTSGDASIAQVDQVTGRITGVKAGQCTVLAAATDGSGVSRCLTVRVVVKGKGVNSISLPQTATIYRGTYPLPKVTLTPTSPADGTISWISSDSNVAYISGGSLFGASYGTVTLTAIASSGLTASCLVSVASKYEELMLDPETVTLGAGEKLQLNCLLRLDDEMPAAPDGDPVNFTSDNPKAASVNSATGEIKALKAGSATITARTASGLTAQCQVTVRNAPSKVAISAPRTAIGVRESLQLSASFPGGTGGTVTWSLPAEQANLATIDASTGFVSAKSGTGVVTPIIMTYNGKTTSLRISIVPAPSYLMLNRPTLTLCAGDHLALTPVLPLGSAGAVSFTSDTPDVASVDVSGVVTAGLNSGDAAVRAETYNGRTARCLVTVVQQPKSLSLQIADTTFGAGETRQLATTLSPVDTRCTLSYASSNPKAATVSETGLVRGVKAGTATITVTAYNGVPQTITVTIRNAPSSVALSCSSAMGVGEIANVQVTTNSGSAGAVALASSNSEVLRVNADGTVTALATGHASLTATTYNGKMGSKTINVLNAPVDNSLHLEVDGGGAVIVCTKDTDAKLYTVARGDYTTILPSYQALPDDEEEGSEDMAVEQLAAGAIIRTVTDPSVVSFGASNQVNFVKNGVTDISYTTYNGVKRTVHLSVVDPPTGVSIHTDGPAFLCTAAYELLDTDGSNLFTTYDLLHYSISSSNPSILKVYKPDRQNYEDFGTLWASKLGSADITVKLFNGLNNKRKINVRRNRFLDNNLPDPDDLEEDDYTIFCYSAEILASNKVQVVYYIYNNGPLKLTKLTNVEAGFVVEDDDLCSGYAKSLTLNLKPYSVKVISLTFAGRAVDSDIAIGSDLTQYAGEDEEAGTYGYLNANDPYDDYEGDDGGDYDDE